jgi:putative MATE family efflux protein
MSAAPRSDRTLAPRGLFAREAGAMLALAWPLILANLAVTVMTTTDYVMLGLLSPGALAAGALGFNLYQPAFLLGIGVVAAVSPIAATKIGARESIGGVRRATHQALLSALLIAAAAWTLLSQTTAILTLIGEPPELARDAGRYMSAFQWGLAPNLMFFAGRSVFAALERPRLPLIAGLIAVVFNALANYALIFGKFGLPAFGIVGSGLATTLSQTLTLALLVVFSLIDPRIRRLKLFALPWRLASGEFAALWRLGLPIGLAITAEVGVFSAATLAMGLLGRAALEAHTIALQIAALAFMAPLGLGQAASVRIGLAYGARDPEAIARAGAAAFGLTLRPPLRCDDGRRAPAPHFAVHGGGRARKRRGGRRRRRAAVDRRGLPDLRREPGDAGQYVARPARLPLAARHRARRLLGNRRAGWRRARIHDAARRRRNLDRSRDRPRNRRAPLGGALARQSAPRVRRLRARSGRDEGGQL